MKLSRHRTRYRAVVLLGVLLAGCTAGALSIDVRVTLYSNEQWKAEADVLYSAQQMQLMGDLIEQSFARMVTEWETQGLRASYSRRSEDRNVLFRISASGQGFAKLNAALFDNLATLYLDEAADPPQIVFSYFPAGTFFSLAQSRTFRLTGGRILSSNGVQASGNTAAWVNPTSTMQATLTPAPRPGPMLLLAGGGLLLVGAMAIGVRRAGRPRCYNCGVRIPRQAEYCTNCGAPRDFAG